MHPWNCIFISPSNAEGSFPARKTIAAKAFLLTTQHREFGVISTSSSIKPTYMLISLGKKPRAVFVSDAEALAAAAADFVRRMKSEEKLEIQDIVILTVSTLEKSMLAGVTSLAGIPLAHQPAEGKVWFTTVRRYKGLEAKAVLLVDVHVSKLVKPTCQRLVYVGSSRAFAYLETIFLSDVSAEEYPALVEQLDTAIEPSPQGVAKWLGMEAQ